MWSLFPKMLSKLETGVTSGVGVLSSGVPTGEMTYYFPDGHSFTGYNPTESVNLSQQKKLTHRMTSSKKGISPLTPIHRQHSQVIG